MQWARAWWLLATLVFTTGGCAKKAAVVTPSPTGPPGPPMPSEAELAAELHTGIDLPAPCDVYRRKLLRCVENEHFPRDARDAERSALAQMLAMIRQSVRQKDRAEIRAAEENCVASLAAMQESGKESCPGVF